MQLEQEGCLFSACLATGLTELRTAHVHNKEAFYSALFNLSVGAERLLKVIVIMEHMLNNNLAIPSKHQLKGYGHNIVELYDRVSSIAKSHGVVVPASSLDKLASSRESVSNTIESASYRSRYGVIPTGHYTIRIKNDFGCNVLHVLTPHFSKLVLCQTLHLHMHSLTFCCDPPNHCPTDL